MANNDAMKASPSEIKKRTVADLLRERVGYERRMASFEAEENADAAGAMQDRIDQVNAQLRHFGHDAAPAAKRSEKRPAVSARAEQR